MKLLIKLALTALVANAAFRLGTEYLIHYNFRDSVREAAMFRAQDDAELRQRVMETAETYAVPLAEDGFTIRRESRQFFIEGSYVKPIQLVPGFRYPWRFAWAIDAYVITQPKLNELPSLR